MKDSLSCKTSLESKTTLSWCTRDVQENGEGHTGREEGSAEHPAASWLKGAGNLFCTLSPRFCFPCDSVPTTPVMMSPRAVSYDLYPPLPAFTCPVPPVGPLPHFLSPGLHLVWHFPLYTFSQSYPFYIHLQATFFIQQLKYYVQFLNCILFYNSRGC